MNRWITGLGVATAFLSVGCSADRTSADVPPSAAASATESKPAVQADARYTTVMDLRLAAVRAGYSCPSWQQDDAVTLAAESGSCSSDDVFATFASEQDLQDQVETDRSLSDLLTEAGVESAPVLVGPNWSIKGPRVPDLADELGGTVAR